MLIVLTFGQIAVLTVTPFLLWLAENSEAVMNEQQLDAPAPRPEFAPKRGARNNLHPTDQTGEALIAMLLEASRVLRDNDHRLVDSSSRLSARFHHAAAEATDLLKDLCAGFPSLCDLSTRWRSTIRAITCLRKIFAVLCSTVEAGSFLLTVFNDFGTDEWRKMLRSQHTFDQLLGKPIILMASL